MWVPGNLPPNLVFLIMVTRPTGGRREPSFVGLPPRDAVAADTADEVAHLEDAEGREHAVDG